MTQIHLPALEERGGKSFLHRQSLIMGGVDEIHDLRSSSIKTLL